MEGAAIYYCAFQVRPVKDSKHEEIRMDMGACPGVYAGILGQGGCTI